MTTKHPQEKIVEAFDYNGILTEIVEWTDTIWCGKIGYASNITDEPDVDNIIKNFHKLNFQAITVDRRESDWDACLSVNYLSEECPNGVMFGFLVSSDKQPDDFDVFKVPAAQYARIRMCDETAKLLDSEPWKGGIPPYEWIGEKIAPRFGYKYGNDSLPIIEYYGYYNADKHVHEFCYLYVPVEKN